MSDPRIAVVAKRLSGIRRVLAFSSAKGGVGKTMCTVISALALARGGRHVGVLDLDMQGASAHLFLGVTPRLPEEKQGILPLPVVDRVTLMSVAAFTGERGLPLRGAEISDAILELLAVTIWGPAELLLIDMPPGMGEEILDLSRLVPRLEALVVSTPAVVSVTVVERLLSVLKELRVPVPAVVANMVQADSRPVRDLARRAGVARVVEVPQDPLLESAVGAPDALAASAAGRSLAKGMLELGYL
ncbi:MAG TPA: P-loop NTPase [Spirochaetia bacterium]|nr:P-loop NTPase [Spirochaetia bacterium]